jgi:hypothetical protein
MHAGKTLLHVTALDLGADDYLTKPFGQVWEVGDGGGLAPRPLHGRK